jgi:hypothetical protein
MYKNKLFLHGAKHIMRNKGSLNSTKKRTKTGAGLDDYLLSLIGGVHRMTIKPKTKPSKSRGSRGGALRFVR